MTRRDQYFVAHSMMTYGGKFAKGLGQAILHGSPGFADSISRHCPNEWNRYKHIIGVKLGKNRNRSPGVKWQWPTFDEAYEMYVEGASDIPYWAFAEDEYRHFIPGFRV